MMEARDKKTNTRSKAAGSSGAGGKRVMKKKLGPAQIAGIVVGAIVAVLLILFLVYRSWAKPPELPSPDEPAPPPIQSTDPAPGQSQQTQQTPQDEPVDDPNEGRPLVSGERKDGFYTFLIVGRDTGGGGNTDTLMLAAYDTKAQEAALMSIPRDTMVNAPWDVKKINTVYNYAEVSRKGSGVESLRRYVATLIGFQPDYTVVVEWEAVGEIVDAVGGVWFEVPFYMHYKDPAQNLYIDQPAGYRLLSGDDAMQVVRWRQNNDGVRRPSGTDGSDLGRTKVQQDFIAAMIRQCMKPEIVTKLDELAQVFSERVSTELTTGNLVWFAEQAVLGGFSTEDLFTCTMPNTGAWVYCRTTHAQQSFVTPNAEELIELVNDHFNPYMGSVTMENLDIMRVNGDGSISSSTGVVRDTGAKSR